MGTIKGGILGGFAGKVGAVIGGRWKDKDVMKGLPRKRTDNPTAIQLEQRAKIKVMVSFLRKLSKLLRKTFRDAGMSGGNFALRQNIQFAITGNYPSYGIDFSKVVLAKGSLEVADGAVASAGTAGKIVFNWNYVANAGDANGTDTAIIISYCPDLNRAGYDYTTATRIDNTATLEVPGFSGKLVHTWMTFSSKEGVADSVYCGSVTVL
jgi:hypothetical protein